MSRTVLALVAIVACGCAAGTYFYSHPINLPRAVAGQTRPRSALLCCKSIESSFRGVAAGEVNVPTVRLNSGFDMPLLGLGTSQTNGVEAITSTAEALLLGYRHFDTAMLYGKHITSAPKLLAEVDLVTSAAI